MSLREDRPVARLPMPVYFFLGVSVGTGIVNYVLLIVILTQLAHR